MSCSTVYAQRSLKTVSSAEQRKLCIHSFTRVTCKSTRPLSRGHRIAGSPARRNARKRIGSLVTITESFVDKACRIHGVLVGPHKHQTLQYQVASRSRRKCFAPRQSVFVILLSPLLDDAFEYASRHVAREMTLEQPDCLHRIALCELQRHIQHRLIALSVIAERARPLSRRGSVDVSPALRDDAH